MTGHFFIVGAQRSGTSWLYRMLQQHPDIAMARPLRPEPKFFIDDAQYANGMEFYRERYFPPGHYRWHGEKSTSYIEHRIAAERIARDFPDAMIVFMLRDPVERALSNYRFSVGNGVESLPLEQALEAEDARSIPAGYSVSPYAYAARGHYVRYLDMWSEFFPRAQMVPLIAERTLGSEAGVRALLQRLQLDADVCMPEIATRINAAGATNEPASLGARRYLRDAYRVSNKALAQRYGVDVDPWQ